MFVCVVFGGVERPCVCINELYQTVTITARDRLGVRAVVCRRVYATGFHQNIKVCSSRKRREEETRSRSEAGLTKRP
jgi:hypothetical protein